MHTLCQSKFFYINQMLKRDLMYRFIVGVRYIDS